MVRVSCGAAGQRPGFPGPDEIVKTTARALVHSGLLVICLSLAEVGQLHRENPNAAIPAQRLCCSLRNEVMGCGGRVSARGLIDSITFLGCLGGIGPRRGGYAERRGSGPWRTLGRRALVLRPSLMALRADEGGSLWERLRHASVFTEQKEEPSRPLGPTGRGELWDRVRRSPPEKDDTFAFDKLVCRVAKNPVVFGLKRRSVICFICTKFAFETYSHWHFNSNDN